MEVITLKEPDQQSSFAGRRRSGRSLLVVAAVAAALAFGAAVVVSRDTAPASAGPDVLLGASDLAFSTQALTVKAGQVTLALANTDAVPHTFTVRELDLDISAGGGEAARATFTAVPGTYDYICTIPGHDTEEMRGVLTVTP